MAIQKSKELSSVLGPPTAITVCGCIAQASVAETIDSSLLQLVEERPFTLLSIIYYQSTFAFHRGTHYPNYSIRPPPMAQVPLERMPPRFSPPACLPFFCSNAF